jgi:hypothetical protein
MPPQAWLVAVAVGALASTFLLLAQDEPARGEQPDAVVFAEDFSNAAAVDQFNTSGAGQWSIRKGSYVLRGVSARGLRLSGAPLSMLRRTIDASQWSLAVTARTNGDSRAEFSVVFAHADRGPERQAIWDLPGRLRANDAGPADRRRGDSGQPATCGAASRRASSQGVRGCGH